jgi:imidazolonepropionase-like amidohydrolase
MRPQESIYCATMNPAKLLRQESNIGSLAVGKFADIVGCRADPLADISEITRIAFVMKGGAIYKDELAQ